MIWQYVTIVQHSIGVVNIGHLSVLQLYNFTFLRLHYIL